MGTNWTATKAYLWLWVPPWDHRNWTNHFMSEDRITETYVLWVNSDKALVKPPPERWKPNGEPEIMRHWVGEFWGRVRYLCSAGWERVQTLMVDGREDDWEKLKRMSLPFVLQTYLRECSPAQRQWKAWQKSVCGALKLGAIWAQTISTDRKQMGRELC